MPAISMLDAIKIQARALIPVVHALEAEIGAERAHAVVGRAIAESWADFRAKQTTERNTHPARDGEDGGPGYPVEEVVVENTEDTYGFDIKACAFADYFRKIGEPEIGALLTCGVDFAEQRVLRPEWEFSRSQTRMQGATHCDFRWRRRSV